MGSVAARLSVIIGAEVDDAVKGVEQVDKGLGGLEDRGNRVGDVFKGVFGAQLLQSGLLAFRNMAKEAISVYANYESLGMSLQALAARELLVSGGATDMAAAMEQSSGSAQELLGWVEELAMISPFDAQGVTMALRTAMAYGFTTDEAKRLTEATIDYASATGASVESMNTIALALGQIKAKGALAGQEVLQLVNAGIDVNGTLARAFGVSTQEIVRMREEGLIPAEEAIEAIVGILENDFAGAAENASDSFGGLMSTLAEVKDIGLREFFGGMFEELKPIMKEVIELMSDPAMIENLRSSGQAFGDFVGKTLNGLMDLVTWFGGLDEGTQGLILNMGTAALAMGPLTNGITGLVGGASSLVSTIPALSTAIGGSGVVAGTAAVPMGLYAAALISVVAAGIKIKETSDMVQEGSAGVDQAIKANIDSASSAGEAYEQYADSIARMNRVYEEEKSVAKYFIPINKMRKDSLDDISASLAGTSSSYSEYITYMKEALLASGALTNEQVQALHIHEDTGYVIDMLAGEYGLVTEAMYTMGAAAISTLDPQSAAMLQMQEMTAAAAEAAEANSGLSDSLTVEKEAAEAAAKAQEILVASLYNGGNAADYFSGRLDALVYNLAVDVEELQTLGRFFDNLFATEQIDAESLVDANQLLGIESVLQAYQGGILSAKEATASLKDDFGLATQEAQNYIKGLTDPMGELSDLLGGLDVQKILEMSDGAVDFAEKLELAWGWAQDLRAEVDGLDGMSADITIRMNYTGGDVIPQQERNYGVDLNGNGIIGMADGGDWMVRKPTLFMAGEAGPERAIFIPQSKRDLTPTDEALRQAQGTEGMMMEQMMQMMLSLQMTFEQMPERIADAVEVR